MSHLDAIKREFSLASEQRPSDSSGVEKAPSLVVLEKDILARAQAGDRQAFDCLVIKYQHRIGRLLLHFLRDKQEAQDLCQEVFLKAYQNLHRFRGDSAFYTWLYRIAVNTVKNQLVVLNKRRRHETLGLSVTEELPTSSFVLQQEADPADYCAAESLAKELQKVLDSMSYNLRTALVLREIEQMCYEEIAVVMDCPVGTVRSRIFRAREEIDRMLRPWLQK